MDWIHHDIFHHSSMHFYSTHRDPLVMVRTATAKRHRFWRRKSQPKKRMRGQPTGLLLKDESEQTGSDDFGGQPGNTSDTRDTADKLVVPFFCVSTERQSREVRLPR